MATVSVRYIVDDVDAAISFYCAHLGFTEKMHPAPNIRDARTRRPPARSQRTKHRWRRRASDAGRDRPRTRGWNRFMLEIPDLATTVTALREAGVNFRNDIVTGVGGKQILLNDPSGNPVELFEPTRPEASLHRP